VSSVTNMNYMFQNAFVFDQDISSWNVLAASVAPGNSTPPTNFDLNTPGTWTTAEKPFWGTDGTILYPLTGEVESILNATWISTYAPTSYAWDATVGAEGIRVAANDPITSMQQMFEGSAINNADISAWDVSTVTNMQDMFSNNDAFNQDISSWDVSNVTNMNQMFYLNSVFNNGGVALDWADTSSVTNMQSMFQSATAFNQDVSSFNLSSITTMINMFRDSTLFNNGGVAFSGTWSTTLSATSKTLTDFFRNAISFNQDVSSWDMSSVTSIGNIFKDATAFNNGGVALNGNFASLSNVGDFYGTFWGAGAFNQDISNWDVSGHTANTGMQKMFQDATAFDQDISGWDVSNTPSLPTDFDANTSANWTIDRKPSWGTTGMIHDVTFGKMVAMFDIREGTPTLHNGSLHTQTSAVGYDILTDFGTVLDDARYSAAIANATRISILIHDISQPANFATGMAYVGSAIFSSAQVTELLATSPVPWPSTTLTKIGTSFETNNINGQLYKSGPQIGGPGDGQYSSYYTYDATPATGGYWPQALTRAYMPIYAGLDPAIGVNASLYYNTSGRNWYGWHGTNKDVMTIWIQ